MMLIVTMVRKGYLDRQRRVRVTDAALRESLEARGYPKGVGLRQETIDLVRDDLARSAAVRAWFGRSRTWGGDRSFPHRGQVWESAKGGGQNAVTSMITLRVSR